MTHPLTPGQLDALAAWWNTGSVRLAAEQMGLSAQTVKNHLAAARQRSRKPTTLLALKANWRAVGERHRDLNHRLRYHFDADYAERHRRYSREAMRRQRATVHNTKGDRFEAA